jgi:hypothetical protein
VEDAAAGVPDEARTYSGFARGRLALDFTGDAGRLLATSRPESAPRLAGFFLGSFEYRIV